MFTHAEGSCGANAEISYPVDFQDYCQGHYTSSG